MQLFLLLLLLYQLKAGVNVNVNDILRSLKKGSKKEKLMNFETPTTDSWYPHNALIVDYFNTHLLIITYKF